LIRYIGGDMHCPEQQGAYVNKSIESWRQTYKEQHHLAATNRKFCVGLCVYILI
jgi:hypothetical protein